MKKIYLTLVFGVMSMLLTYGIAIQIKTVNNNGTTVNLTAEQSELKSEILKISERYNNLSEEIEILEKKLEEERQNSTKNNSTLANLEESIKQKNTLLGLTEVSGTGVKIVLNDSNISINNYLGNISDLLVHDGDLMHVVNELFNADAEAISINGQRIVGTTSIECDGNVIKVNGFKIGAPFEILAIGYPEYLAGIGRIGGYLERLESRGIIVSLTKQNTVTVPKYTGTFKFTYATNMY